MRTFIVGTRAPKQLGVYKTTIAKVQTVQNGNLYYLVTRGFAGKLQGFVHSCTARNGTLYGVFSTRALALAHQKINKMGLYTTIVAL